MSIKRSKRVAIDARRQRVAERYLLGWKEQEIAHELSVAQSTISGDVNALCQQWRESALRDISLAMGMELEKLDRVAREAWSAWERSQKPQQSADLTGDQERPTRKRIRNQYGDPRFLSVIHNCLASRRTLLGLDATVAGERQQVEASLRLQPETKSILDALTTEEVLQLRDLRRRAEQRLQQGLLTIDVEAQPAGEAQPL